MKGRILFSESQTFAGTYIWYTTVIVFAGMVALFGWGLYVQLIIGTPWGDNPMNDMGLILTSVFSISITGGIMWLIQAHRLKVEIDEGTIRYSFQPYFGAMRELDRHDLMDVYPRKYKPIAEFGGWGNRGFGKKKAFNIAGSRGLQLELQDGRSILLGTQKYDELCEAIVELRKLWGLD